MATKKIKRFESGGVSDKDRGLEASKEDKVGFFERMRMGNIDEEGSEAYRRFGAGRGRNNAEITPAREPAQYRADPYGEMTQAQRDERVGMDDSVDELEAANARPPITVPAGPRAELPKPVGKPRVNVQAGKPSAPVSGNPRDREAPMGRGTRPQDPRDLEAKNSRGIKGEGPPRTTTGRTAATPGNIPGGAGDYTPVAGKKVEKMSDAERNLQNILMGAGAGAGVAGAIYKGKKLLDARKAAQAGAKKRANLKRDVEEGIERNLADELQNYSSSAAEKAVAARQRADKTLNPNAWMSGPKGMADDFKRGGKVKPPVKKMASGGMVSSASKRADGIATKGKTRCKMR
jgi:hypothetical protein